MTETKTNLNEKHKKRLRSEKMNSDFVNSLYPSNFERINEESYRSTDSIAFLKCDEDSVFLKNKFGSENRIISDMKFFNKDRQVDPNDINVNLSNIDDPIINEDDPNIKNLLFSTNGKVNNKDENGNKN